MKIILPLLLLLSTIPAMYVVWIWGGKFNPVLLVYFYVIVFIVGSIIISFVHLKYNLIWTFWVGICLLLINLVTAVILGYLAYIFGEF
jgi:hypothetical protein